MEAGEPLTLPGADEDEWSQYGAAWVDMRDLARIAVDCLERPPGIAMNVLSGHFVWHDLLTAVDPSQRQRQQHQAQTTGGDGRRTVWHGLLCAAVAFR